MTNHGSCLCGAVRYETRGPLRSVVNCHCSMCLKWHGHFGAYTGTTLDRFTLVEDRGLKWYRSSVVADRGFCCECGSSLFWRKRDAGTIGIAAGTLAAPTGLRTKRHEFVAFKSDYYDLTDELEKRDSD
jgi:hypothetical protein